MSKITVALIFIMIFLTSIFSSFVDSEPQNIKCYVTNITSASVTIVAYIPNTDDSFKIRYKNLATGDSYTVDNKALKGTGIFYSILTGLNKSTEYEYSLIVSDTVLWQGKFITLNFTVENIPSKTIYGKVYSIKKTPIENVAIIAVIERGTNHTHPLSTLSGNGGYWVMDLGGLVDQNNESFAIRYGDNLKLIFLGGKYGSAIKTLTIGHSDDIYCGITYIDTNLYTSGQTDITLYNYLLYLLLAVIILSIIMYNFKSKSYKKKTIK